MRLAYGLGAPAGGAATQPTTSFTLKDVGVNVTMTPKVTYDNEIRIDLTVENSAQGADVTVAGQALPSFTSRKVNTTLRLRDGESNLLAGLIQEQGAMRGRTVGVALRLTVVTLTVSGTVVLAAAVLKARLSKVVPPEIAVMLALVVPASM